MRLKIIYFNIQIVWKTKMINLYFFNNYNNFYNYFSLKCKLFYVSNSNFKKFFGNFDWKYQIFRSNLFYQKIKILISIIVFRYHKYDNLLNI